MPNLFQTVPADLFRPLAARGAPVYSAALLTLFAQTRRQQQPLSRDIEDDEPPNDDVIVLFELELTNAESLAPPARAATLFIPETVAMTTLSADQIAESFCTTGAASRTM